MALFFIVAMMMFIAIAIWSTADTIREERVLVRCQESMNKPQRRELDCSSLDQSNSSHAQRDLKSQKSPNFVALRLRLGLQGIICDSVQGSSVDEEQAMLLKER